MHPLQILKIYLSNWIFNTWFLLAYFEIIYLLNQNDANHILLLICTMIIFICLHYINVYRYLNYRQETPLGKCKFSFYQKMYPVAVSCIFLILFLYLLI